MNNEKEQEKKEITEKIARVHQKIAEERAKSDTSLHLQELTNELASLYERYIALVSPKDSPS